MGLSGTHKSLGAMEKVLERCSLATGPSLPWEPNMVSWILGTLAADIPVGISYICNMLWINSLDIAFKKNQCSRWKHVSFLDPSKAQVIMFTPHNVQALCFH
jgi:hypothetical protein